jgi:pimeloyl-ACP methyl ester carboxylesterase
MTTLNIRGVDINYEIIGSSGPWVILITGGRRGYTEFIAFANKIAAKGFRVILHDRRNTGASDILIEGEDGEEEIWTDDLAILLEKLGAVPAFVGGTSSGARMSMLFYTRHPKMVKALMLMRITGGDFAAGRLPEMYYQQFIRAAEQGGMAAVCATEQYQERIKANPRNRERLMAMDPKQYIAVMSHWLGKFLEGPRKPVLGMHEETMRAIKVPTIVIPGNDNTHASVNGIAAAKLIPGAILHQLPIVDQDVPLLPFTDWAPYEPEMADVLSRFMKQVDGNISAV